MNFARLSVWTVPSLVLLSLCACQRDEPIQHNIDVPDLSDAEDASPDAPEEADACQRDEDCPGGQACREGLCTRIEQRCQEDLDCAGGEQCVDDLCVPIGCSHHGDCAGGEVCRGGQCVSPGEAPCEPFALGCLDETTAFVCDGQGVQEVLPCNPEQICQGGACVAQICEPGQVTCEGDALLRCNEAGTATTRSLCAAQPLCQEAERGCACVAGECAPRVCAPGSSRCAGAGVQRCDAQGLSFLPVEPCSGDELCLAGGCVAPSCEPGQRQCQGDAILGCAEGALFVEEDCATQGLLCDAASVSCQARLCAPGQASCQGDVARVCGPRGDGFVQEVDCAAQGQSCLQGQCIGADSPCPVTLARAGQPEASVSPQRGRVVVSAAHPVLLDGSQSSLEGGPVQRVTWSVLEGPVGWQLTDAPGQARSALLSGLAPGERYLVAAQAHGDQPSSGCARDTLEIYTVDEGDVVFHLLWSNAQDPDPLDDQGSDVDLRLLRAEQGRWNESPYDISFLNPLAMWPGGEQPQHLRDDQNGRGPEVIVLSDPAPCQWYSVGVNYWQERFGPASYELRVFIEGELVHTLRDVPLAQTGAWSEPLLLHWPSRELFEVGHQLGTIPRGERPVFPQAALESGLCGIPSDLIDAPPSSCRDHLGSIGSLQEAAPLATYEDLRVCPQEADYFTSLRGGSARAFVDLSPQGSAVQAHLSLDPASDQAAVNWSGGLRTLDIPAQHRAVLRVSSQNEQGVAYGLRSWLCQGSRAAGETQAQARLLAPGNHRNLHHCGGQSWWRMEVPDQNAILINFAYGYRDDFNVDAALLTVLNEQGETVAQHEVNGGGFGFIRYELPEGDYYLRLTSTEPDMAGVYHIEYELIEAATDLPDLSVQSENELPVLVEAPQNAPVDFPVRVRNQGDAPHPGFQLHLYQVEDEDADPFDPNGVDLSQATLLSSSPQAALAPGAQRVVTLSAVPAPRGDNPEGVFPLWCVVASADPPQEEEQTDNNRICIPLLLEEL